MTLSPSGANLLLVLLGRSSQSAIRPGEFSAINTLALIERLKAASHGVEE